MISITYDKLLNFEKIIKNLHENKIDIATMNIKLKNGNTIKYLLFNNVANNIIENNKLKSELHIYSKFEGTYELESSSSFSNNVYYFFYKVKDGFDNEIINFINKVSSLIKKEKNINNYYNILN